LHGGVGDGLHLCRFAAGDDVEQRGHQEALELGVGAFVVFGEGHCRKRRLQLPKHLRRKEGGRLKE